MEKDTVIKIALTVVLAVYLGFALTMSGNAERAGRYSKLRIEVADSLGSGFVTLDDISRECDGLINRVYTDPRGQISLGELERRITDLPVVEHANVAALNDGSLRIDVEPMVPVARVFTPGGSSYYINASGKRVTATARYHVDVPIVVGTFDAGKRKAADMLPMLSYIASDPTANALVSAVALAPNNDILLIPVIRGQIINFGDTSAVADKFARLKVFYADVMPVKGWNTYDTISVKWAGQVVASRRVKSLAGLTLETKDSEFDLVDDAATMLPDEDGFVDEDPASIKQSVAVN